MLNRMTLKENLAKLLMQQIILGCEAIHHEGYIHRDLKPANILLKDKKHIRIADLGFVVKANTKTSHGLLNRKENVGSPYYMSP